jgi:nicotinamidase-related amidase
MLNRNIRHPHILRTEDALLLCIDMQEPFLRSVWQRDRAVKNVGVLLDSARILRLPVVPTLQFGERMGGLIPELSRKVHSQCVPFDKLCFSCCGDPAIVSEIQRSGRKSILICGVESHICVAQTALDLVERGYAVHVAADAVTARSEENCRTGLKRMEQAGALITSTEAALYDMLGAAGTPEFKAILELIK